MTTLLEESFPNMQPKLPLVQFEAVFVCPFIHYLGEETTMHPLTTLFEVAVESKKVSPEPPSHQAKRCRFPQLLLVF